MTFQSIDYTSIPLYCICRIILLLAILVQCAAFPEHNFLIPQRERSQALTAIKMEIID